MDNEITVLIFYYDGYLAFSSISFTVYMLLRVIISGHEVTRDPQKYIAL